MKMMLFACCLLIGCGSYGEPTEDGTYRIDDHVKLVILDGDKFYYYKSNPLDDYSNLMKIVKSNGEVIYGDANAVKREEG